MTTVGRTVAWSAVAGTIGVLLIVPRSHDRLTTYASASSQLAAADVLATSALLVACFVGLLVKPARPGVTVLGLAGLVWTVPDWVGWQDGPDVVRSAGLVLAPLVAPLLAHAVLAASGRARQVRPGLVAWYAVAAVVGVVHGLWYRPYVDASCFGACDARNVLLVDDRLTLVRWTDAAWLLFTMAAGAVLAAGAVAWWVNASPAGRRVRGPALAAALVLGVVLTCQAVVRWRRPRIDPTTTVDVAAYLAVVAAACLVAGAWLYGPALDRWTRRGVARLVSGLGSATESGTVARVLASATGDPGLRLLYRLPESGAYAAASGRLVTPPALGRGVTSVRRDEWELAVVLHDVDAVDADAVRAACGPAVLLALDNERLRAEALSQLDDLRASRARIVAAGDTERRQLERNLHDGAQQRMLAVTFDLRRAVAAAAGSSDRFRDLLTTAERESQLALTDLRDVAHGINPALLDEAGLAAALWSLADTAPVPLELEALPSGRLPEGVERAAYVVVREALDAAEVAGADRLAVTMAVEGDHLVIVVRGAGPGPFVAAEDRVAGAGGYVEVEHGRLRAVIPTG